MDATEYDNIARVEATHWWYKGMAAISLSLLRPYLPAHLLSHILDAGCGTGGMLLKLAALGQPIGLDFHPLALAYAQTKLPDSTPLMQASVTAVPLAGNAFDLIVSFDVLYHQAVGSDDRALTEFWRILKPGGLLLVRLPALESLRGEHDVVVHTRHRYERTELGAKLQTARFQLLRLTYANGLLLPLIYLRRQLQSSAQSTHVESDVSLPSPLINRLLESILTLERLWLTRFNLPIGVSLFALAAKPN